MRELLGPHSSRPYNPDIANTFFRAGEIESWGRGIQRIFESCRKLQSPKPEFQIGPSDFWIKFRFSDSYIDQLTSRSSIGGTSDAGKKIGKTLPTIDQENTQEIDQENTQEKIFALLREHPNLTRKELATGIGITSGSIKYHLDTLRKAGRIRHVGPTKKGNWEVIENKFSKTLPKTAQENTQENTQEIAQENTQEKIIALLREHPNLTRSELATKIGITSDSAKHHLGTLRKTGRIHRVGPTKKGHWEVIENDIDRRGLDRSK